MAVGIWTVLQTLVPLFGPIVSTIVAVMGKVLWNHERRIRNLEQDTTRQGRTIYGDSKDDRQAGLSQDIQDIAERARENADRLDSIEHTIEDHYHDDDQ